MFPTDSPTKFKVLDFGVVELQDIMGDDLAIVNAARTSYLSDSKGEEKDKKLLFYLMDNNHSSPFEMVEFKFILKMPLMVLNQLVRHRTASLNVSSGRYTEFSEESYVPAEWRFQDFVNKQGSIGLLSEEKSIELTKDLLKLERKSRELYRKALDLGVAKEQARLFLLGFGVYYTVIWKIDLRNLLHFLDLRLDSHAQYEIRQYAKAMEQIVKIYVPWTYEAWKNKNV